MTMGMGPRLSINSMSQRSDRRSFQMTSPRLGNHFASAQTYNNIKKEYPNLGALNNYKEKVDHQIMSRRQVESLTFLEEEGSNPSYERNENDAYVGSAQIG